MPPILTIDLIVKEFEKMRLKFRQYQITIEKVAPEAQYSAARLSELFDNKKITMQKLAGKAKISRTYLYRLMSSKERPNDTTLELLGKALGVIFV